MGYEAGLIVPGTEPRWRKQLAWTAWVAQKISDVSWCNLAPIFFTYTSERENGERWWKNKIADVARSNPGFMVLEGGGEFHRIHMHGITCGCRASSLWEGWKHGRKDIQPARNPREVVAYVTKEEEPLEWMFGTEIHDETFQPSAIEKMIMEDEEDGDYATHIQRFLQSRTEVPVPAPRTGLPKSMENRWGAHKTTPRGLRGSAQKASEAEITSDHQATDVAKASTHGS